MHFETSRYGNEDLNKPVMLITMTADVVWEPEFPDNLKAVAGIRVRRMSGRDEVYNLSLKITVVESSVYRFTAQSLLQKFQEIAQGEKVIFDWDDTRCIELNGETFQHWVEKTLKAALPVAKDVMAFYSISNR